MICPDCGAKMNGFEDGKLLVWECPRCNVRVIEEEDPDYDDMPEGCASCGGNWPWDVDSIVIWNPDVIVQQ